MSVPTKRITRSMSTPTRPITRSSVSTKRITRSIALTKPATSSPKYRLKHRPVKMNTSTKPTTRSSATTKTSTTSIEDLPTEMICELFKYLRPKHLAACSLVNKRWYSIYTGFKVRRLAVVDEFGHFSLFTISITPPHTTSYCVPSKCSHSDPTTEDQNLCSPAMFSALADHPLLSNLKYLCLSSNWMEFDLNKLNAFSQLVQLKINIHSLREKEMIFRLNLPKLKVLVLHQYDDPCPLSVDCPQLNSLVYYSKPENESLLQVKQPESVRMLETNMVGAKLVPFRNVESLVTKKFEAIAKATLLSLPKLKELRYIATVKKTFEYFRNEIGTLDRVEGALEEFLDDLSALRRSDFQFTFAGFRLTKSMLEQIDFGMSVIKRYSDQYCEKVSDWYIYMENYQHIEPGALNFIRFVNYNRLVSNGEIPSCFLKKFTGIEWLLAKGPIQNTNHFLRFLSSLRSLRGLRLENVDLGQEFYDQLPVWTHSLSALEIHHTLEHELQLNFDFVGKLALSWFTFNRQLTIESLSSLVRSLGKLEEGLVFFKFQGINFIRKSRDSKEWKLSRRAYWKKSGSGRSVVSSCVTLTKAEHLEEIVSYFEELQNKFDKRFPIEPEKKKPRKN